MEDILTLDFGSHLTSSEGESEVDLKEQYEDNWDNKQLNATHEVSEETSNVEDVVEVDKEIAQFEKNKEKVSSINKSYNSSKPFAFKISVIIINIFVGYKTG